ncbi:hypothetical protein [Spirosoma radiotolerans]|uniref:Uncharacterized protein n=1 Tax=Spirosoma radiotolerans TaxID=1379870 RepID=A0A0E3V682_9BACT|nr:hypothetical protein [Spirosoma radiotolerans]AKD54802.1 hypothetical protein SD10_07670 [Spirosoma radiotolerans]
MKIGERLLKHLNKKYEPSRMIAFRFGRYDVATKTDEEGNPILLFIGNADERGIIKGDQFSRRLLKDANGVVVKDHWDYKGKV